MAQLCVLDCDAPVLRRAADNAQPSTLWVRLEVLARELMQDVQDASQRRPPHLAGQVTRDPTLEGQELPGQLVDRRALLLGVAPVAIERLLDVRLQQQRDACLAAQGGVSTVEQLGGAVRHLACRVAYQINGVLDAPGKGDS